MFDESEDPKKVAIYMRVSTEEQAQEGYSLDAQLDKLRSYCSIRTWTIAGEYVDAGLSGRHLRRPEYNRMLQDMKKWDGILVIKMDRIHRNSRNFMFMMDELRKQNKEFISIMENLDTGSAMGRFVMDIIQRIAQLESEQTGERVFIGMEQKAKDETAGFVGHRVPFGYRMDKSDPENHKIVEVPKDLEIVKQAFQLYQDGFSLRQIAKKLGKANSTIKYYLGNCFYAGMARWCHHFKKAEIDPIITKETFEQIQEIMRSKAKSHHYDPLKLKDKSGFSLSVKERKNIPVINRAKHNFNY